MNIITPVSQTWVCDPPTMHAYDGDITDSEYTGALPTHDILEEVVSMVVTRLLLGFMYESEPTLTLRGSERALDIIPHLPKVAREVAPDCRYSFVSGKFVACDEGEYEKFVCSAKSKSTARSLSILIKTPDQP